MNDDDLFLGVVDEPPTLITARLQSEPLRIDHAEELAPVLDDRRLHQFIGGQPLNLAELRTRYERQIVGRSGDGREQWFNWVVRENASGFAVGQIQVDGHGWPAHAGAAGLDDCDRVSRPGLRPRGCCDDDGVADR